MGNRREAATGTATGSFFFVESKVTGASLSRDLAQSNAVASDFRARTTLYVNRKTALHPPPTADLQK